MGVEVEPLPEMDWGDLPGPPPGPPPGMEREPDPDGTAGFRLRIVADTADDVFTAIESAAGVSGVRYAEPNLLMRLFSMIPVNFQPSAHGWGRDATNRVWIWTPPPGAPQGIRFRMGEGWTWSGDAAAETGWHWSFARGEWVDNR